MIGVERLAEERRLWKRKREGNRLRLFVGTEIDERSVLEAPVRIGRNTLISDSRIGRYSFIGDGSMVHAASVGRFCSGAWGITLGASAHPLDRATTHTFPLNQIDGGFVRGRNLVAEPVHIGHDVWIGCNAVVFSGIRIGDGAVVGAGAVVTHDVPDYTIVVGSPARPVRLRYDESLVERLSAVAWWNWPTGVLRENIALFQAPFNEHLLERLEHIAHELTEVGANGPAATCAGRRHG
jgi:virginiamycin A acetyltransferase